MQRADDLKDGDKLVFNIPLRVETTNLLGRTKVLDGQVRVEMLVQVRDGKLDLIISDPAVSGA